MLCFPITSHAQKAMTCDELKALSVSDVENGKAAKDAFYDCIERGEDPPLKFRKARGTRPIVTSVGNNYKLGPCRPAAQQQCPNNVREYTDGTESPSGYDPNKEVALQKKPLPWGKMKNVAMPCGAVSSFAKNALNKLLGNVDISEPPSMNELSNMINAINYQIDSLQSRLNSIANLQGMLQSKISDALGLLSQNVNPIQTEVASVNAVLSQNINGVSALINQDLTSLASNANSMSAQDVIAEKREIDSKIGLLQQYLGQARVEVPATDAYVDSANQDIANIRGKLNNLVMGVTTTKNETQNQLNTLNAEFLSLANVLPAGVQSIIGQINNQMAGFSTQVMDFVTNISSMPQGQINSQLTVINGQVDNFQSFLQQIISFISGISSNINSAVSTFSDAINTGLTTALGNLFKYKDCQNGEFWGVLNFVYGLVMGQGEYTYNYGNNTFSSANSSVVITLPLETTININLNNGVPNPITLPFGGVLYTSDGQAITFGDNTTVYFNANGQITTSTGNSYTIDPNLLLQLDPNEAVAVPPDTPIPVPPNDVVYPTGPDSNVPEWLHGYINNALEDLDGGG